ncbi:sigma-70 family RNA polymerase sigma factor [Streptomyces sp. NBC_00199]|uniref:sigma-70 family RNA polymerase sigma factor n=1 Tax=Streptomyces sp. NBC_00199 TaxID=2975678 RepID=UPI0022588AF0|nr:sigma-70 family RNA polymerase sigma factor [Streptomyces sp. NBC_00199]MCX5264328.1 sigma-70 family RNA polymerase sigma factor [Streptomyces sp. NBC_00199]
MTDRSPTVPAPPSAATGAATDAAAAATAEYARVYAEQQPRLVAYARSLTRNAWTAEDLVAEAHFRVWRRLAAGHEIDNVPAYLRTTVRHLAIASGSTAREAPSDPQAQAQDRAETGTHGEDPAERVAGVDLVVRVLGQLPERWVKALWLAEAEGQPLAAIGPQLGTKDGATAVLLHRAREGMRQAFLRAQTGAPDDPACQVHWARMPAYVRGAATARQSERLLGHVDTCDACRASLAALMRANDRLPAVVGPALLVLALGGTARFLPVFTAASAGVTGTVGGHGAGVLHGMRHAVSTGARTPTAATAGALVVGAAVVCLVLGWTDSAPPPHPPASGAPVAEAPVAEGPVTGTAVSSPPPSPTAARAESPGTSVREADVPGAGPRGPVAVAAPRDDAGAAEQAARRPASAADPTARPTPAPADEPSTEAPQGSPPPDEDPDGTPQPTPPVKDPEPEDPEPTVDDGHKGHGEHGEHGGHRSGSGHGGCPTGPPLTGAGNPKDGPPHPRSRSHSHSQAGTAPDREAGHPGVPHTAHPH